MSSGTGDPADEDARWIVVNGRRWRRTDPSLPDDLVASLTSHLGRARAAVKSARSSGAADALADARRRVGLAKHGLGERGPAWWEEPEADRLRRAHQALEALSDGWPASPSSLP